MKSRCRCEKGWCIRAILCVCVAGQREREREKGHKSGIPGTRYIAGAAPPVISYSLDWLAGGTACTAIYFIMSLSLMAPAATRARSPNTALGYSHSSPPNSLSLSHTRSSSPLTPGGLASLPFSPPNPVSLSLSLSHPGNSSLSLCYIASGLLFRISSFSCARLSSFAVALLLLLLLPPPLCYFPFFSSCFGLSFA